MAWFDLQHASWLAARHLELAGNSCQTASACVGACKLSHGRLDCNLNTDT